MPEPRFAAEALAHWIGTHALVAFGLGLCLVLVSAGAAWHFARRHVERTARGAEPAPVPVALLLVAGFAVLVGASLAFAEIAERIGDGSSIERFDAALASTMGAEVDRATREVFATLTRLGDPLPLAALCALVAAALLASGRRKLAFAWLGAFAGTVLLNETLKRVFERVRPLHEPGLVQAQGWSFPSGHSSGAVVAYGMFAYVLLRVTPARWHLPIVLVAAAVAFTVGTSRVFVQAHFASDVLAGFLSGSAWLAACVVGIELARRSRGRGRDGARAA